MAFMRSTRPSREVFRISGGVCGGKVSLKCADEYNLQGGTTAYTIFIFDATFSLAFAQGA